MLKSLINLYLDIEAYIVVRYQLYTTMYKVYGWRFPIERYRGWKQRKEEMKYERDLTPDEEARAERLTKRIFTELGKNEDMTFHEAIDKVMQTETGRSKESLEHLKEALPK